MRERGEVVEVPAGTRASVVEVEADEADEAALFEPIPLFVHVRVLSGPHWGRELWVAQHAVERAGRSPRRGAAGK
jgi:hypothetical protein